MMRWVGWDSSSLLHVLWLGLVCGCDLGCKVQNGLPLMSGRSAGTARTWDFSFLLVLFTLGTLSPHDFSNRMTPTSSQGSTELPENLSDSYKASSNLGLELAQPHFCRKSWASPDSIREGTTQECEFREADTPPSMAPS